MPGRRLPEDDDLASRLARSPRLPLEDTMAIMEAAAEGRPLPAGFWQTADHRILKISDMTDEHVLNTIRVFEGRGRLQVKDSSEWSERPLKYDEFMAEAQRRGLVPIEEPHPDAVKRATRARRSQDEQ